MNEKDYNTVISLYKNVHGITLIKKVEISFTRKPYLQKVVI